MKVFKQLSARTGVRYRLSIFCCGAWLGLSSSVAGSAWEQPLRTDDGFAIAIHEMYAAAMENDAAISHLDNIAEKLRRKSNGTKPGLAEFYDALEIASHLSPSEAMFANWERLHPTSPTPIILRNWIAVKNGLGNAYWRRHLFSSAQEHRVDHDAIRKISAELSKTKLTTSNDPFWYVIMGLTALVLERDDAKFKATALEGIKRHPGHFEIYDASADYFLPKWNGSADAFNGWVDEISEIVPGHLRDFAYARLYLRGFLSQFGDRLFIDSSMDWQRFKSGSSDVAALAPHPDGWAWVAMMACLAGDHATTAKLFSDHPGEAPPSWPLTAADMHACEQWASKSYWRVRFDEYVEPYYEGIVAIVGAVVNWWMSANAAR